MKQAGEGGFEPPMADPKSVALSLGHPQAVEIILGAQEITPLSFHFATSCDLPGLRADALPAVAKSEST